MNESLTAKVTEQGVVIPREWFAGVDEVEIRRENGRVVVDPLVRRENDPIWNLGKNPIDIDLGATDISTNLDRYLYDQL
jgi:virulence-associated protein VagC